MSATQLTQASLAAALGVTQSTVSKKLRAEARWSLDDIDSLRNMGVPVRIASGQDVWP